MSKTKSTKTNSADEKKLIYPLGPKNFKILGVGVFLIALGFYLMALPDNPDDFLTLTLAPIILVIAFVVVIPLGIMYREKINGNSGA
jgi:hypothetical protein